MGTKLDYRDEGVSGLYKARVEDNRDEYEIGRVRIRIPHLHGIPNKNDLNDKSLKFDELPWAYPCMPYPCGFDHGSFVIPEVGTYVWVMFEAGDTSKPVYIGSVYSAKATTSHTMGTYDSDKTPSEEKFIDSNGEWIRPSYHGEAPKGSFKKNSKEPNLLTVYKSLKGATLEINERDEEESMTFIDRLGQVIKFICPVTKKENEYNKSRRYARRVDERPGTGGSDILDTEKVSVGKRAVILIRGARDQVLRMVSKKGECRTDLVSTEGSTSTSSVSLESGKGRALLFSECDDVICYLELNAKEGEVNLVLEEHSKVINRITLNKKGVNIFTTKDITYENKHPVHTCSGEGCTCDYSIGSINFKCNNGEPEDSEFSWSDVDEGICSADDASYPTDEDHDYKPS